MSNLDVREPKIPDGFTNEDEKELFLVDTNPPIMPIQPHLIVDASQQVDDVQNHDVLSSECIEGSQESLPDNNAPEDQMGCISCSVLNTTSAFPDNITTPSIHSVYLDLISEDIITPTLAPIYLDLTNEDPPYEMNNSSLQTMVFANNYQRMLNEFSNSEMREADQVSSIEMNVAYNMTSSEAGQAYDYINEYEHIAENPVNLDAGGEQSDIHNTPGRPLPIISLDIYEHLETPDLTTSNNVSSRKCFLIAKIALSITVCVVLVVTTVVITNVARNIGQYTNGANETENDKVNKNLSTFQRYLHNSRFRCVLSLDQVINGIAVVNNQLFVAQVQSDHVNVFNISNNFSMSRNITVIGSPHGFTNSMIANPRLNCLYILDPLANLVRQYSISNNATTQWSVGKWPSALSLTAVSLTSTDNILVTLQNPPKISEYSSDGAIIRNITLDSSMEQPFHSIQFRNDQFLVSVVNRTVHRVCIVNNNGSIIQCFGGVRGPGIGQFHMPRMLVVDRHDNVLVADLYNNRIVVLSPTLTHLGYIAVHEQLSAPSALYLDELNHRLFIGDITGSVFELTLRSN